MLHNQQRQNQQLLPAAAALMHSCTQTLASFRRTSGSASAIMSRDTAAFIRCGVTRGEHFNSLSFLSSSRGKQGPQWLAELGMLKSYF